MTTKVKLENPYWTVVQTFPNSGLRWNKNLFEPESYPDLMRHMREPKGLLKSETLERTRHSMVAKYAWAIPSDKTIYWLAERFVGQKFVEVGAGRGYWAWLLEQVGISVTAYDEKLISLGEHSHWFNQDDPTTFHLILRGTPQSVVRHSDKVLFLCWPPYSTDMAVNTLRAYQGDTLVYVGEGHGGCCADDDFFALLDTEWDDDETHRPTQWEDIHDYLTVYRRTTSAVIHEEP